jgi:hypothetical protein
MFLDVMVTRARNQLHQCHALAARIYGIHNFNQRGETRGRCGVLLSNYISRVFMSSLHQQKGPSAKTLYTCFEPEVESSQRTDPQPHHVSLKSPEVICSQKPPTALRRARTSLSPKLLLPSARGKSKELTQGPIDCISKVMHRRRFHFSGTVTIEGWNARACLFPVPPLALPIEDSRAPARLSLHGSRPSFGRLTA